MPLWVNTLYPFHPNGKCDDIHLELLLEFNHFAALHLLDDADLTGDLLEDPFVVIRHFRENEERTEMANQIMVGDFLMSEEY